MRLLFIDCSVSTTSLIQLTLISTCSAIERVKTGEEALACVKLYYYDAVFMDLVLPDMDGYDAIVQLRKISDTLKIFILSSLVGSAAKTKALLLGANVFLPQPLDEAKLARHVDELSVAYQRKNSLPKY